MNFSMSGQSINDRITAARHSLAGQGLAKSVCKATTEEIIGPKKKHLDYLLHCTNEPNVSIPQLANLLIERTQHNSWVVVFKALITIHHLMCYGNERFTQYLASSNCTFQLSSFLDKGGVQGYDMSTFIRRYAKYLNEKAYSYRTVAFDFCKVKRGKDDGVMRTLSSEKLLKTLPVLQNQLDALLEFDCTPNELTNGVVNSCFLLMFRDLIRLFACYNDGIINLLEKYFDMNKKMCKEALDIYKKFLIRMDRVAEFLKVAENVGIDKGEIPDLAKAPGSLLDALEQHLASLEGKKTAGPTKTKPPDSLNTAVNTLNNTSNSFDTAAVNKIDATERKRLLEEEQARLNQLKLEDTEGWDNEISWMVGSPGDQRLKELAQKEQTSPLQSVPPSSTNPFASMSSPGSNAPSQGLDLFGSPTTATAPSSSRASDDLLSLSGNPFAANIESVMNATLYQQQQQENVFSTYDSWTSNNDFTNVNNMTASYVGDFGSEAAFAHAFGNNTATMNNFSAPATNTATSPVPPEDLLSDDAFGLSDALATSASPLAAAPVGSAPTGTTPLAPSPMGTPSMASVPMASMSMGGSPMASMSMGGSPMASMSMGGTPMASLSMGGSPLASMSMGPSMTSVSMGTSSMTSMSMGTSSMTSMSMATAPMSTMPIATSIATPVTTTSPTMSADLTTSPTTLSSINSTTTSPALAGPTSASMPGFDSLTGFENFGEILKPTVPVASGPKLNQKTSKNEKLIKGDIDSSLASLAQNLNINGPGYTVKKPGQQWNSPKNTAKTGGANWQPQMAPATAPWGSSPQHSYKPMGGGSVVRPESGLMGPSFAPAGRGTQTFIRPVSPVLNTGMGMGRGISSNLNTSQPTQPNLFRPVAPGSTQMSTDPFGAL